MWLHYYPTQRKKNYWYMHQSNSICKKPSIIMNSGKKIQRKSFRSNRILFLNSEKSLTQKRKFSDFSKNKNRFNCNLHKCTYICFKSKGSVKKNEYWWCRRIDPVNRKAKKTNSNDKQLFLDHLVYFNAYTDFVFILNHFRSQ